MKTYGKFICLSDEAEQKLSELSENDLDEACYILSEAISNIMAKINTENSKEGEA